MALRTIRSGVNNHPEKTVLQFVSDSVRRGGVMSGFNVSEKAGGTDMSVDISAGTMYAKGSTSVYPINSDAIVNVSVPLNSTSNPRIDLLIAYVDLTVTPTASGGGEGIAQFVVIPGTPAASPTSPTERDIVNVIGSSAPYEEIAQIYVGAQVTAIIDENITEVKRQPYIKTTREIEQITANGRINLDAATSDTFEVTMTGDITLGLPENMRVGDWIYVTFVQDSTGGRTLTISGLSAMSPDMSVSSGAGQISNFAIQRTTRDYQIYAAGRQY